MSPRQLEKKFDERKLFVNAVKGEKTPLLANSLYLRSKKYQETPLICGKKMLWDQDIEFDLGFTCLKNEKIETAEIGPQFFLNIVENLLSSRLFDKNQTPSREEVLE